MQLFPVDEKREVMVADNTEAASYFALVRIVNHAKAAIAKNRRFSMALSGGSTPKKVYELLATSELAAKVDWGSVDFFWSDERTVPPDHQESNYRMAMEYLGRGRTQQATFHRMPADEKNLPLAAKHYDKEIRKSCQNEHFDLVLLGLGEDGHTASLFPETEALKIEDSLVAVNYIPKLQSSRMTLTFPCINQADRIIVLAFGHSKAAMLKDVLSGEPRSDQIPAQRLGKGAGTVLFIVDEEAATHLFR